MSWPNNWARLCLELLKPLAHKRCFLCLKRLSCLSMSFIAFPLKTVINLQTGIIAHCISQNPWPHSVHIGSLRNARAKQIDKQQRKVSTQAGTPRIFKGVAMFIQQGFLASVTCLSSTLGA